MDPRLAGGWTLVAGDSGSAWMPDEARQFLAALLEVIGDPERMTTIQSFMIRQSVMRAWGEFQETHPLTVAPICTDIPFEVGSDLTMAGVVEVVRGLRMAIAVNALGLPAVAVPVGMADALPRSVQVIGPRYREDVCLDAAAALEERVGIITPIDPRSR